MAATRATHFNHPKCAKTCAKTYAKTQWLSRPASPHAQLGAIKRSIPHKTLANPALNQCHHAQFYFNPCQPQSPHAVMDHEAAKICMTRIRNLKNFEPSVSSKPFSSSNFPESCFVSSS
jgi:hypothetical protein